MIGSETFMSEHFYEVLEMRVNNVRPLSSVLFRPRFIKHINDSVFPRSLFNFSLFSFPYSHT